MALATAKAACAASRAATNCGLSSSAITAPRSTMSPTFAFNVTIRAATRGLMSTRSAETSP
jgi:hypothetical protein